MCMFSMRTYFLVYMKTGMLGEGLWRLATSYVGLPIPEKFPKYILK